MPNRMLKKSASFVLAALRGSTYRREYASPLRLLWPRWTTFLNIPRALRMPSSIYTSPFFQGHRDGFSTVR